MLPGRVHKRGILAQNLKESLETGMSPADVWNHGQPEKGGKHMSATITRSRRVLIVDDSEDVRLMLRFALSGDDRFEVLGEATDGADALEQAWRLAPDYVLLDLAMPNVDGRRALPRLRESLPDATIVIFTAHEQRYATEDLMERGADGVVRKTESLLHLRDTLAAIHH